MRTELLQASKTSKLPTPEVPYPDQTLYLTKGRIGLPDLDMDLDCFEAEALKQFQDLSYEDRRAYVKHVDRYVIKLRREFFHLCTVGYADDWIRERFKQSIADYQGILKQFQAGKLAYQTAYKKETDQNLDLKTRITNAFLQNADWAFCDGIPPAIDYDKIPPAMPRFSFAGPHNPPQEYAFQETQDIINEALCYWENQTLKIPNAKQKDYLDHLECVETFLLGKMKLHEERRETPAFAHYKAQEMIADATETLEKKFPRLPQ